MAADYTAAIFAYTVTAAAAVVAGILVMHRHFYAPFYIYVTS